MSPRMLADRWLRADMARFVSGVVLAMVALLTFGLFATAREGRTAFGVMLGADFGEFHAVGMLLNEGQGRRLYDLDLQDEWVHRAVPSMPREEHLPFAYPPFLATAFRPLARLSYAWSFAGWLAVSLACYAASVALMLRCCDGLDRRGRLTIWWLALSFEPFAMECWLGGQLSGLGCLATATALACRLRGRTMLAGLCLAGLLYKPTLPLLLVPLMVVGRQWRMLAGFAVGGIALSLISLAVAGESACLDFARLLVGYGRQGGSLGDGFRTIKYVDLRAFFRLLGVDREASTLLAGAIGLPALAGLAVAGWRGGPGTRSDLAWAAALCWTPVLNVYGPVYDVCLVVPGLILAAGALRPRDGEGWPVAFRWLVAGVYLSSLVSQAMARGLGFQPLTLALAAMGGYLLRESLRGGTSGLPASLPPRPAG